MTARIARMTDRQKKVARHSIDVLTVALLILGVWLASGVHTMTPKETHTEYSTSVSV